MFQEFPCRYPEIGVFLKTLKEKVAGCRGGALGEGRVFVVDDAEERGHGV